MNSFRSLGSLALIITRYLIWSGSWGPMSKTMIPDWAWRRFIVLIILNRVHDRFMQEYWNSFQGCWCSMVKRLLGVVVRRISKLLGTIQMMVETRMETVAPAPRSCPKAGWGKAKWSAWRTRWGSATPTGVLLSKARFQNRIQACWTTTKASWVPNCRDSTISKSWKKNRGLLLDNRTKKSPYSPETFHRREALEA